MTFANVEVKSLKTGVSSSILMITDSQAESNEIQPRNYHS